MLPILLVATTASGSVRLLLAHPIICRLRARIVVNDGGNQAEHQQANILDRREFSASASRGTLSSAMTRVATVPAKKDEIAAMASAVPARPCRAIW